MYCYRFKIFQEEAIFCFRNGLFKYQCKEAIHVLYSMASFYFFFRTVKVPHVQFVFKLT